MSCSETLKSPGELLILAMIGSGSEYIYAINTSEDDGRLISQQRRVNSLTIPDMLRTRLDMIPQDMFIKNLSIGPDCEWFLQYNDKNDSQDKAFWDVPYSLCADFLQARFRSCEVSDFVVAFGPNLSYVILDGDRGFVMSKNVSSDLRARIMKTRKTAQGVVYALSLFPNGGFFVRDSEGVAYAGAPPSLVTELNEEGLLDILNIHVASDYSWVVLRRNSFSCSGVCANLKRVFESHYGQQLLYRQARATEIGLVVGLDVAAGQKKEKVKLTKEERRQEKIAAKEKTQQDMIMAAMKKRLLVQRITIATAKGLKPGEVVTVAGLSRKSGDCTIESATGEGIIIVSRNNEQLPLVAVDDLRRISRYHNDESPRMEMVKLVKATDKFEAAVVSLPCPICGQKMCRCEGVNASNYLSSTLSRSSDNTPTTNDLTENGWDSSAKNHSVCSANSWEGPSVQSEAESEGPLSTSRSLSPDEVKTFLARDEPIPTYRVDFLPIFEFRGERLPFGDHRCAEKIDFTRLVRVFKDVRKDRSARLACVETLLARSKAVAADAKLCAFYIRKLMYCHELELSLEALYNILKGYPVSDDGYVVHEVEYEHRDDFLRGTLFAVGKNIRFEDRRYPRNTTLQAMQFDLLPCLCGAFAHYIEAENCIARILCSVAEHLNVVELIPTLLDYRDNYQAWTDRLAKYHKITEEAARKWPNIIMMGETFVYKSWLRSVGATGSESDEIRFAFKLAVDVATLTDEMLRHRKFRWAIADKEVLASAGLTPSHVRATQLTRIIKCFQNDILSHLQRCCHNLGWITRVKAFDSLILEKSRDAKSSLSDALKMCQTSCAMQGWDLKLVEVPMHGKQDDSIKSIQDARTVLAQLNKKSGT